MKTDSSRRSFIKSLFTASAAVAALPLIKVSEAFGGDKCLASGETAGAGLISSPIATAVKYVDVSPDKKKNCANCIQYTGNPKDLKGQGGCKMFMAPKPCEVKAAGYCNSWAAANTK